MTPISTGWKYYAFEWATGTILAELPAVQMTWSMEIGGSKIQGAIDKKSITRQSLIFPWGAFPSNWDLRQMLMPGKIGFAAEYDGVPVVGGIIGDREDTLSQGTSFPVTGLTDWLDGITIVKPSLTWRQDVYQYKGLSLGTIGKRIVAQGLAKAGASIPMIYDPDELTGGKNGHEADYHTKTYQGFDVANLSVTALLEKLSNLELGPDFDFRLVKTEDSRYSWWMRFGTENDPALTPGSPALFYDLQGPDVLDFKQIVSAKYRTDRVWQIGNGQDVAETGAYAENDTSLQKGWPLQETVQSDSTLETDADALTSARGALSPLPLAQWAMTVSADTSSDGVISTNGGLGHIWPGDVLRFRSTGFPTLPDGLYQSRILEVSGTEGKAVDVLLDTVNAVI